MRKKEKIKNRVSALLLSGVIVSGLIVPTFSFTARAEALPEILESSATVADCVMSYYAMSGSAVANTQWINTLYNSLGSSFGTVGQFCADGLLTYADEVWQPTQQLISNIENASAYTELGLDTVFNVSQEQVAAGGGVAVATGGTTLAGATGCVASTGILPVLGGVTASYWGGIALGTLVANKIDLYGKVIGSGLGIDTSPTKLDMIPDGSSIVKVDYNTGSGNQQMIVCGPIAFGYYYGTGDNRTLSYGIFNNTGNAVTGKQIYTNRKGVVTTSNISLNNNNGRETNLILKNYNSYSIHSPNMYQSYSDYQTAMNGWINKTVTPNFNNPSPDQIGENGNLSGQYDNENQKYTVPDMKPQIDPGTQAGKPLSIQDWLDFANAVQNNNNNINPTPDGNQGLFGDIMDLVRTVIPTPGPTPDPGPDPGSETYPIPGPVPDPSPVPDPDYQPETRPQPDFTEKQTENQTDITEGDPWTTPDLLDKFPFCIPKDIYRVFTKLDSKARSAPHIQWRFHPNNMIDYTFDIDFSQWDSIAILLRTLELLAFIVGLAIGTRKLIIGG